MATPPPTVVPAIGYFNPADGGDPNAPFDATNAQLVNQLIELGSITRESKATLFSALRSAISQLAASLVERQHLEGEIETLEEQLDTKQAELDTVLLPALNSATANRDAIQAELDAELAKEHPDPDRVADLQDDLQDAQQQVNEASDAAQAAEAEIDQITTDIAEKQDLLEQAVALAEQMGQEIRLLAARIKQVEAEDPLTNASTTHLVQKTYAQPREAQLQRQRVDEARVDDERVDLDYEQYGRAIETLVQEVLAQRGLEDLGEIPLDAEQVRRVLEEIGINLADLGLIDLNAEELEILQPLVEAVSLLVLEQELYGLLAQKAALEAELRVIAPEEASQLQAETVSPPVTPDNNPDFVGPEEMSQLQLPPEGRVVEPGPVDDDVKTDRLSFTDSAPDGAEPALAPRDPSVERLLARLDALQAIIDAKSGQIRGLEGELEAVSGLKLSLGANDLTRSPAVPSQRAESLPLRDNLFADVENAPGEDGTVEARDQTGQRDDNVSAAVTAPPEQSGRTTFDDDAPVSPSRIRIQV